jgi:hypothetical protein
MGDRCPYCDAEKKEDMGEPRICQQFKCATFLYDSPVGDHRGYDCLLNELAQLRQLLGEARDGYNNYLETLRELARMNGAWGRIGIKGKDKTSLRLLEQSCDYAKKLAKRIKQIKILLHKLNEAQGLKEAMK